MIDIHVETKDNKVATTMAIEGRGRDVIPELIEILDNLYKADKKLYLTVMDEHITKVTSGELDNDE